MKIKYSDLIVMPLIVGRGRVFYNDGDSALFYSNIYQYDDFNSQSGFEIRGKTSRNNIALIKNECGFKAVCSNDSIGSDVNIRKKRRLININVDVNIFLSNLVSYGFWESSVDTGVFYNNVVDGLNLNESIMCLNDASDDGYSRRYYGKKLEVNIIKDFVDSFISKIFVINKKSFDDSKDLIDQIEDVYLIKSFIEFYVNVDEQRFLSKKDFAKVTESVDGFFRLGRGTVKSKYKLKEIRKRFLDMYKPMSQYWLSGGGSSFVEDFEHFVNCFYEVVLYPILISEKIEGSSVVELSNISAEKVVNKIVGCDFISKHDRLDLNGRMGAFSDGLRKPYDVFVDYGAESIYYGLRKGGVEEVDDYQHFGFMIGLSGNVLISEAEKILSGRYNGEEFGGLVVGNKVFKKFFSRAKECGFDLLEGRDPFVDIVRKINSKSAFDSSDVLSYINLEMGTKQRIFEILADVLSLADKKDYSKWFNHCKSKDLDKIHIFTTLFACFSNILFQTYRDDLGSNKTIHLIYSIMKDFIGRDVDECIVDITRVPDLNGEVTDLDYSAISRINCNNSLVSVKSIFDISKMLEGTGKSIKLTRSFYKGFLASKGLFLLRSKYNNIGSFSDESIIELSNKMVNSKKFEGLLINSNKNIFRCFDYLIVDYLYVLKNEIDSGGGYLMDNGLFYKLVMKCIPRSDGISVNPIVFSNLLMFDYMMYAQQREIVNISNAEMEIILDFSQDFSNYSVDMRENIVDFEKYLYFNVVFSKIYSRIVKRMEVDSIGSLPQRVRSLYNIKNKIGNIEVRAVKPSSLVGRLVSSTISGSNNYMPSNSLGFKSKNSPIIGGDGLLYDGEISTGGNCVSRFIASSKVFYDYFLKFGIESIDVEKYMLNIISDGGGSFELKLDSIRNYYSVGAIYGFSRSGYFKNVNNINDNIVNSRYFLSGVDRSSESFIRRVTRSNLDFSIVIPIEVCEKNIIGEKVKIHYYYMNVSYNRSEDNVCTKLNISFDLVNRYISESYPEELNEKVRPVLEDLIADIYSDNYNILGFQVL